METQDKANTHERSLVSAAASGDLQAFNELVLKFQDLIYSVTQSILGDRDAAEDATQETFISAFEHMGDFRGGSFRSWLLRIAKNTCYDVLRTLKRRPSVALFPEDGDSMEIDSRPWLADPRPSLQAQLESDEFSRIVYRCLDELPTPFRTVITLIDLNGIDYAEAAQALDMPIGTIKSRLARARLRIKESLSRDLHSGSEFRRTQPQAEAV